MIVTVRPSTHSVCILRTVEIITPNSWAYQSIESALRWNTFLLMWFISTFFNLVYQHGTLQKRPNCRDQQTWPTETFLGWNKPQIRPTNQKPSCIDIRWRQPSSCFVQRNDSFEVSRLVKFDSNSSRRVPYLNDPRATLKLKIQRRISEMVHVYKQSQKLSRQETPNSV